ncbi:uncharacterized protein LOC122868042 [Siniperca chuatsi]|uniref:uncharacterized protein LOC122868042 n=1 Tax=Siniperca chuatsi TaxID=119488 RepID=UPI001CE03E2D|nr:uncharacterized protein LOC122868042 [Siniperca chuatsi]
MNNKDPQPGGSQKRSRESDEEEDRRGLPGPSRKRSRKHDKVEDERSSKKSGQHYEFADSNSDTVTVRTGHDLAHSSSNIDLAEGAGAVEETEEEVNQQMDDKNPQPGGSQKRSRESDEEEDRRGLPGPSRKRSRKHDKVEDERSSKKSGQHYEFADSNSDTVTVRTGHDLAHSSSNIDLAEGAGAVEETEEEVNQQMNNKDPQPGGSQKRSRESDEEEDRRGLPGPSRKRSRKHDKVEDERSSKNQDSIMSLQTATLTLLQSELAMILLTVVAILIWLKVQVLWKRLRRRDLRRDQGKMMKKRIGEIANDSNIKMRHQ